MWVGAAGGAHLEETVTTVGQTTGSGEPEPRPRLGTATPPASGVLARGVGGTERAAA